MCDRTLCKMKNMIRLIKCALLAGFTLVIATVLFQNRIVMPARQHNSTTIGMNRIINVTVVKRTVPRTTDLFPGIQRVLYINLYSRKDRRKALEAVMADQGISTKSIVRIAAIAVKKGAIGCLKSHIAALKYASENFKGDNIIVFEDDVVFKMNRSETRRKLEAFWGNAEVSANWNVLMFAKNIQRGGAHKCPVPGVVRITDALTASAFAVNGDYVSTLLARKEQGLLYMTTFGFAEWFRNDQYVRPLQGRGFWYAFHPPLCVQLKSYSNIERRIVNYGV